MVEVRRKVQATQAGRLIAACWQLGQVPDAGQVAGLARPGAA